MDNDDKRVLLNNGEEPESNVNGRKRKWQLRFVEPVAVMYMMCILPNSLIVEQYIYGRISMEHNFTQPENGDSNNSNCRIDHNSTQYLSQETVHSETSQWTLYGSVLSTFPAFLATLWLGTYSDAKSRKLALICPLLGAILSSAFSLVVYHFGLAVPFTLIGFFLNGFLGGFTTMLMGFFAYTADVSNHKWRTLRIVLLEISMTISASLSSLGFGFLLKSVGLFYPALSILLIHCLNLLYVIFILPENIKANSATAKFFSWKNLVAPFRLYIKNYEFKYTRAILLLSIFIFFIWGMPLVSDQTVNILFLQNSPLCFSVVLVSIYQALALTVPSLIGLIGTILLQRRLGDVVLLGIGCISGTVAAVVLAFSTNIYMVFAVPFISTFIYLPIAMLRSIMSKMINPKEQGTLFASIATVESLCSFFGSLLMNSVYSQTVMTFGGAVYILVAGLRGISLIFGGILFVLVRQYDKEKKFGPVIAVNSQLQDV